MQEQLRAQQELANQNQGFVNQLFENAEIKKRETQKQNIITTMNLMTSQFGSFLGNPKVLFTAAQYTVIAFGGFHLTKVIAAYFASTLLGRFGKPSLVRETSKIFTNNYLMVPWMYSKKFIQSSLLKKTEADLLKGVILDKKLED
jgi:tetrahydromethanopterin S-methyltransferase subunit B